MIDPKDWWRQAVLYQIYPRSFMDQSGDGIGDLAGIIQKLDYVASLGVDGIWISPFFKSPMKDFGYDVEDYKMVDPMFGTIDDFRRLLDEAHKRNLKIIIDQVWAHTADTHSWFQESRSSTTNAKADWYIWRDAKPDGTPPNNWLSVFGGPCWTWDTRREQYYLHHYLTSQPKLNWRNPEVKARIFEIARYWLDMGVDGFRLDTMHHYLHDPECRDNPPRPADVAWPNDMPKSNPLSRQLRENCSAHPDTIPLIEELRALVDEYPNRVLLAEVGGENNEVTAARYVQKGNRMHLAYAFGLMQQIFDKKLVHHTVGSVETMIEDGWLCWATGNHDNMRVVSRWPSNGADLNDFARFAMAFGLSLRGSFCMFQGEELGLPEAEVPFDLMQDPYGIAFYPEYKGRDGCRTPMPWMKSARHGGFSDGEKIWLPMVEAYRERAVDQQDKKDDSMLNFTRRFIAWRKENVVMQLGDFMFIDTPGEVIAFKRHKDNRTMICVFNAQNEQASLPMQGELDPISHNAKLSGGVLTLAPYGFAFIE